jgi:hypothetical protein
MMFSLSLFEIAGLLVVVICLISWFQSHPSQKVSPPVDAGSFSQIVSDLTKLIADAKPLITQIQSVVSDVKAIVNDLSPILPAKSMPMEAPMPTPTPVQTPPLGVYPTPVQTPPPVVDPMPRVS